MTDAISISTTSAAYEEVTHALADKLNIRFANLLEDQLQLVITPEHIEIRTPDLGNPIFIDFTNGKNAHRRQFGGGRGQPLAKAIGLKKGASPSVIDATAGFGRDAFVLANLGCRVHLVERNPFIATLLNDAIKRASENPDISDVIARMSLTNQDTIELLTRLKESAYPDVIYMDPMYPSREKSALVKKDMRLLHQLAGPDTDSEDLLIIAKQRAKKRIVVKRPKSAGFVGNQKPATTIESKNTRYDVYVI
jgi:16S rRNA (guanine1516-N2)-methyltransferase